MKALIPVKGQSSRVPFKNTRPFAGSSLLEIKIRQLKEIMPVVVNSECDHILWTAKGLGCETVKREQYYATDNASTSEFYVNIAESFPGDTIVFCNVTNPLMKLDSITKASGIYQSGRYDSVIASHVFKEFLLWPDGTPVNYDKKEQPGSQYLPEMHIPTFGACVISKKDMIRFKNVIGDKPYFMPVSQIEAVDIDTQLDFDFAEWLYLRENR